MLKSLGLEGENIIKDVRNLFELGIKKDPPRITKYINKDKWKGLNFPSEKDD